MNFRKKAGPAVQAAHSFMRLAAVCIVFGSLSTGCSFLGKRVNAYERATLSKPGMALVQNAKEQAAMNHMYNAREGSIGGFGGAGGGCGCN